MRPRSNPDRNRKNDGIISLSEVFHVDDDDRIGRYAAQIAMRQELTERELGVMLSGLIHAHYTDQSKKAETNPLRDAIQRRIADENNATLSLGHALFPGTQH